MGNSNSLPRPRVEVPLNYWHNCKVCIIYRPVIYRPRWEEIIMEKSWKMETLRLPFPAGLAACHYEGTLLVLLLLASLSSLSHLQLPPAQPTASPSSIPYTASFVHTHPIEVIDCPFDDVTNSLVSSAIIVYNMALLWTTSGPS